jgi:hypothetical protein
MERYLERYEGKEAGIEIETGKQTYPSDKQIQKLNIRR